jgi:hypothetical protein
MNNSHGLITIAIGSRYVLQAKYLALSCMINSPLMLRAAITDFPELLKNYFDIIISYTSDMGDPFSIKTKLYQYTPFIKTLFIDADSLVVNNIEGLWNFLGDQPFVYAGDLIDQGFWYVDIKKTLKQFHLPWFPQFNSGMFFFNNSEESKKIFETAFYYMENHRNEHIDLVYFRGKSYPDEPFLALALAKYGIKPVEDFTRFSRSLIDASNIHLDITKRIAFYIKDKKTVFPLVVHFCGRFGNLIYRREKIRLFFYFNRPFDSLLAAGLTLIRRIIKNKERKPS